MIAYVFWHWKKADVGAADYEERQRRFHAALAASPPEGFSRSFSVVFAGAPWAGNGGKAYEDWYLVEDFKALGELNGGAVSGSRAGPHDAAASAARDGTGGLYMVREGELLPGPQWASWFGKPAGMRYEELFGLLAPIVKAAAGVLWMRQLTLGPAREFCIHSAHPIELPSPFETLAMRLRMVWPLDSDA